MAASLPRASRPRPPKAADTAKDARILANGGGGAPPAGGSGARRGDLDERPGTALPEKGVDEPAHEVVVGVLRKEVADDRRSGHREVADAVEERAPQPFAAGRAGIASGGVAQQIPAQYLFTEPEGEPPVRGVLIFAAERDRGVRHAARSQHRAARPVFDVERALDPDHPQRARLVVDRAPPDRLDEGGRAAVGQGRFGAVERHFGVVDSARRERGEQRSYRAHRDAARALERRARAVGPEILDARAERLRTAGRVAANEADPGVGGRRSDEHGDPALAAG